MTRSNQTRSLTKPLWRDYQPVHDTFDSPYIEQVRNIANCEAQMGAEVYMQALERQTPEETTKENTRKLAKILTSL